LPRSARTRILRPRELDLKAASTDQRRLLDVQALDTHIDQLRHRRSTLPEHAAIAELERVLAGLSEELVSAETEQSDFSRELRKAEADVDQVRTRTVRDQQRLDSGQVSSPKELESLQHELVTLGRRQSDLEDVVLEVMERLEAVETRHAELSRHRDEAQNQLAELTLNRNAVLFEIDAELVALTNQRETQLGSIDAALVELYEKIRAQQGGIGAAEVRQRRCTGCRLELNNVEINEIKAAADDEVLRCEECRRILVRTSESGL
jgi:hypothetical protein